MSLKHIQQTIPMKSSPLHILSAAVLATIALPPMARAQSATPAAQAIAETDHSRHEADGKSLLKEYASAVKALAEAEKALASAATTAQKAEATTTAAQQRTEIDELKSHAGWQNLVLHDCPTLLNMDSLKGLTGVQHLTLSDCPILQNLDALKSLTSLQKLRIANCPRLTSKAVDSLRAAMPETTIDFEAAAAPTENNSQISDAKTQVEDVAFFEEKYQKKITGVKPIGEYPDPDQFYAAIASQLGIAETAWTAAAAKFGWKKDDGKFTKSMIKGGPTSNGGQGTWDVMFIRATVNPETKKPDPASMEIKMVQLDYEGGVTFPEVK